MPQEDHLQVKEKIISFIKARGPSLPVHIAKEINTSILFTSAFLSELISEKRLKISKLNVGNSSLYFIPGQESLLERFSQHLKSKEKEAFELLKQNKILIDYEQHPAIKVALREIKDFASPFKKDDQIYWKFFSVSDQDLIDKIKNKIPREIKKQSETLEKKPEINLEQEQKKPKSEIDLPLKTKNENLRSIIGLKKTHQKLSGKKEDKFFSKIKEFLSKSSIEILDIEGFSKNDAILRIKNKAGEEKLLIACNKKKIYEKDIINAYKKASKLKLSFAILSLGEPNKKLNEFIEAVKNLDGIKKIE